MGFADLVRTLIPTADELAGDLRDTVQHRRWTTQTVSGKAVLSAPIARKAIVEKKQQQVRTADGRLVTTKAKITFIASVEINVKDMLILSDGTTGPILMTDGLMDVSTHRGFITEVWLG